MSNNPLSHLKEDGSAHMVDISHKKMTLRSATAVGIVQMKEETLLLAKTHSGKKGSTLQVARIAGIMGAKKTAEMIPLCHSLPLSSVEIDFEFPSSTTIQICATVKTTYSTGVEMEALHTVSLVALTIYDMLKAVDKAMVIQEIHLLEKTGGKSGDFHWRESTK